VRDAAEATVFLLVRHALCDVVGVSIAGRRGTVPLNEAGRRQASALAARVTQAAPNALYSSPVARAMQTAEAIAREAGLRAIEHEAFTELDFGDWSGESLARLDERNEWRRFNKLRSWAAIPDGELMIVAQARAVAGLVQLRSAHPGERVVVVTHADIVRSLLGYVACTPLDQLLRYDCDPASVSVISVGEETARILRVNDTGTLAGL
jgi:broad specificity phosphatase PhoE